MPRFRHPRQQADAEYWDSVGASYAAGWTTPAQAELSRRELWFVESHLRRTRALRVLDVGVGVGRILRRITSVVEPQAEVYGVDASRVMLEAAEKEIAPGSRVTVRFLQGDVGSGSLPVDPPMDFISAVRVLKYTSSWESSVAKLLELLADDGLLVFTVPNVASINALWRPPFRYGRATAAHVRRSLERLGASVEDIKVFTRLPDLLYKRANSDRASRALTGAESAMQKILGDTLLGRELFVAARRRPD